MSARLSDVELYILCTRHGNSYEASKLRDRLNAQGLHWCGLCKTAKPFSAFGHSSHCRAGLSTRCHACDTRRQRRRTGYIAHGDRSREHQRRRLSENPKREHELARLAYRRRNPKQPKQTPEERREVRRQYKRTHREQINAYKRQRRAAGLPA